MNMLQGYGPYITHREKFTTCISTYCMHLDSKGTFQCLVRKKASDWFCVDNGQIVRHKYKEFVSYRIVGGTVPGTAVYF